MSFHTLRLKLLTLLASLTLAACGGAGSSAPAPTDVVVEPGDGQVTVTWTATTGVEYWMAYAAASSVSTDSGTPHIWAKNASNSVSLSSPFVLTGLTNGTTYSFSINGRIDGGPGGAGSASISAVPRPGGSTWSNGTASMGTSNLRAVAYTLISTTSVIDNITTTTSTPNYLAAGSGGALYKGSDGKAWTAVSGGPAGDLNAAIYALSKFIVAGAGGLVSTSTDLSTWSAGTSGTSNAINALATNGSVVVAVGDSGTIRYSADGLSWTAAATVPTSSHLYGVHYSASGQWLAVGAAGTLLSSADGSIWSSVSSGTTQTLRSVSSTLLTAVTATTSGVYSYAVVGDGGTVLTSTNATAWTLNTIGSANLNAVVGSASQFLAVGASGTVLTSANGTTWAAPTALSLPSGFTSTNWQGLVFAPSSQAQYVVVGPAGAHANSH